MPDQNRSNNFKEQLEKERREAAALAERKSKQNPDLRLYYQRVAEDAKRRNLWIFDKVEKTWYTPEEFLEKDIKEFVDYTQVLMRITTKDPIEALQEGNKKLMDFFARVMKYERQKEKDKLSASVRT